MLAGSLLSQDPGEMSSRRVTVIACTAGWSWHISKSRVVLGRFRLFTGLDSVLLPPLCHGVLFA